MVAQYRSRAFSVLISVLLTGLCLVGPGYAQVAADQPPEAYVSVITQDPESSDAYTAQAYLAQLEAAAALPAIQGALAGDVPEDAKLLLTGAGAALGDAALAGRVATILKSGQTRERFLVLNGLRYTRLSMPDLVPLVDPLQQDPDGQVASAAKATKARLDELGAGSGLGTFLLLILVTVLGGLGYVATLATQLDPLRGKVLDWTAKPMDRDDILKELREEENVVERLLAYFDDKALTSSEVAGLLDLVAHFDEKPVHEKISDFAENASSDALRSAAIQAIQHLKDPGWSDVLAQFLAEGDEIAKYAAAKAIAERGDVQFMDLLKAKEKEAVPGSVKDGLRDAIERLETTARANAMAASAPAPMKSADDPA